MPFYRRRSLRLEQRPRRPPVELPATTQLARGLHARPARPIEARGQSSWIVGGNGRHDSSLPATKASSCSGRAGSPRRFDTRSSRSGHERPARRAADSRARPCPPAKARPARCGRRPRGTRMLSAELVRGRAAAAGSAASSRSQLLEEARAASGSAHCTSSITGREAAPAASVSQKRRNAHATSGGYGVPAPYREPLQASQRRSRRSCAPRSRRESRLPPQHGRCAATAGTCGPHPRQRIAGQN